MTLRLRLTLWYTFLLAILLAVFAGLFHTVLQRTLLGQTEQTISSQARQMVAIFEADIDPTRARLPTTIVLASQVFAQAVTSNGSVIDVSASLMGQTLALPANVRDLNLMHQAAFYTLPSGEGGPGIRVYSAPVQAPGGQVVAMVQVGQSLGPIEATLKVVRLGLMIGALGALILAAFGGTLLSGAALQPLNEIAETASRIARTEDLEQRLHTRHPDDEVGRLGQTFNAMLERLQSLFNTQQRLVADVSHELRTPLATVQGNIELLLRGTASDPQMLNEGLQAINAEVGRMSRLVRDLLLLAEADAGVQPPFKPIELDTLLLEVYREALLMAQGRVKVRLGHEDQAQVAGDSDRLKQLLLNLVSNAIKFTPEGGTVTLSLHCHPDGWVRIRVSDTGIGIAKADLAHVFDRFWRLDQARNRQAGSTGLGLSIAKWIAEAHGGQLTVESELGLGTTFEVRLPQARASSPAALSQRR